MKYQISYYICVMERKSNAGRRKLSANEKKIGITIWVKSKYKVEVTKKCSAIEAEYKLKP